jgi:hypothetical protein
LRGGAPFGYDTRMTIRRVDGPSKTDGPRPAAPRKNAAGATGPVDAFAAELAVAAIQPADPTAPATDRGNAGASAGGNSLANLGIIAQITAAGDGDQTTQK